MVKLNLKADDDFEFFIEENENDQIDKIEEIDLAEKPKRKNAKKSPKKKGWFQTIETSNSTNGGQSDLWLPIPSGFLDALLSGTPYL